MAAVLVLGNGAEPEGYSDHLEANGLRVVAARSTAAALAALDRDEADAVIVDLSLETATSDWERSLGEIRRSMDDATSLVVISGMRRDADRSAARRAGADLYLSKPVLAEHVYFEIKRALILRRTGRRLPWNWRDQVSVASIPFERRRAS